MVDWEKLTMQDLIKALNKLVKSDFEGRHCFDVTVFDNDGNETDKMGIIVEPGKVELVDGESGEDGAVLFHIKKNSFETMKAMQIEGLDAAMRFMFDGSIYSNNPGGAQAWFEIFEIGEEPLIKALEG
jgi:hypothetical protein